MNHRRYIPIKSWPLGYSGEAAVIYSESDDDRATSLNKKLTIINESGKKIVIANNTIGQLISIMTELKAYVGEDEGENDGENL